MEPKETVPIDGLPPVTKTPKRVTFSEASLNSDSLSGTPSIASLDADPSLPPNDPKINYLSWYTTLSSIAVSSNNKSPSPLSIRSFPPHPRTSENKNSTPRRSFNGNSFSRPSVLATHRGLNPYLIYLQIRQEWCLNPGKDSWVLLLCHGVLMRRRMNPKRRN
ncbi:hypothetical protein P3S67_013595 [Capsicum chacoense]